MSYQNLNSKLSEEKRKFILLEFTRELIRQSGGEIFELENILKEENKETQGKKRLMRAIEKKEFKEIKEPFKETKTDEKSDDIFKQELEVFTKPKPFPVKRPPSALFIPKPKLPQKFQYLRPVPTNLEIDLGKLNSLIGDPLIKNIECNGPDQNIIVEGTIGRKKTNIFLNKEEIDEIVKKFSETTKIPLHEGVFRVVAGRLIFSAIISDLIGSKFVIKKMMYSPKFRR